MNDSELIKKCRQIAQYNRKIYNLIAEIEDSDHPNGTTCAADLLEQCWGAAWADHVVASYLVNPERYETGDYGIRRKVSA